MIKGKKGPYILLSILIIGLFFILGMQYGKNVEKADKTIRLLLSITPTKPPRPSEVPKITFDTYTLASCGISLLRPSLLINKQESSVSAKLSSPNGAQNITISCGVEPLPTPALTPSPITINNISGQSFEDQNTVEYRVRHPNSGRVIVITVEKELAPIIVNSIEFTK